jgi:hypothetical protein
MGPVYESASAARHHAIWELAFRIHRREHHHGPMASRWIARSSARLARTQINGEAEALQADVRGVTLLKFQPDDHVAHPDPRYFTEITGLMNVTACTAVGPSGHAAQAAGPPLFMSMPHFCHVDPAVALQTTGVAACDPEVHDLWLGVEPTTGITMAAAKRLQVSTAFDGSYPGLDRYLRSTILPIFWAEEISELNEHDAREIRHSMYPV